MTTKEKAIELITSFHNSHYGNGFTFDEMLKTSAKAQSIICVKEIINQLETVYYHDRDVLIPYWEEVEREINRL